jgi:hypothetical protein
MMNSPIIVETCYVRDCERMYVGPLCGCFRKLHGVPFVLKKVVQLSLHSRGSGYPSTRSPSRLFDRVEIYCIDIGPRVFQGCICNTSGDRAYSPGP